MVLLHGRKCELYNGGAMVWVFICSELEHILKARKQTNENVVRGE